MKYLISVDMEGISGLTSWNEDVEKIKKYTTGDLIAVINGIKNIDKSAKIVICDSHNYGRNVDISDFPSDIELISGFPRDYYMIEGFTEEVDYALFIGYHAPVGSNKALMDHSYSSSSIYEVRINKLIFGEAEINALVLGEENIPVILISGDDKLQKFSKNNFPKTRFVVSKYSIGKFSARLLHPEKVHKMILENTIDAVKNAGEIKPFKIDKPFDLEITFVNTVCADYASFIPNSKRVGGRKILYNAENAKTLYKFILSATFLAANSKNT